MGAYAVVRYTNENTTESKRRTQEQILEMRLAGLSFPSIGRALGFTHRYVYKLYEEAINAIIEPGVALIRKQEAERLDAMLIPVMSVIMTARNAALAGERFEAPLDEINTALRIAERRAKMFALDIPAKTPPPGIGGPLELQNLNLANMDTGELVKFKELLSKAMPSEEEEENGNG